MADLAPRRRRLLALLPRVLAEQPQGSAVGAVIDAMAASLAQLDEDLLRTQRDHWVAFAGAGNEDPGALERMGLLFGVTRFVWTERQQQADGSLKTVTLREDAEAFRQRLIMTARVLTRGVTTPGALLELAVVTLGAEPCPRQQKHKDATVAFGCARGTTRRCPVCRSEWKGEPCPSEDKRVIEAWLTDNPPQEQSFTASPLRPGERFLVESRSLTEDVPQLRLKALDAAVSYPTVQNSSIGELLFFAGELRKGEILSLWPMVQAEETARFDSYEPVGAHSWRDQYPSGSAVLIDEAGNLTSVSDKIYIITGATFPAADVAADAEGVPRYAGPGEREGVRFADALSQGSVFDGNDTFDVTVRFGSSGQQVRTPRLRPGVAPRGGKGGDGRDTWSYGVYTKIDIAAVADSTGALYQNAPDQPGNGAVELTLSWWVRPPASFRMRIPRNRWVGLAQTRGAAAVLTRLVQQAKAAGVSYRLDFPEPKLLESHALRDTAKLCTSQLWQEPHGVGEKPPQLRLRAGNEESHPLTDAPPVWRGVFDVTRLDTSCTE